jgi:hypothetical protein
MLLVEIFPLSLEKCLLVYTHASVGVFTRTPFSYPSWWIHWSICGCLTVYFPGLKVGKMYFLSSFSTIGWRCLLAGGDAVVAARPKVFRISIFVVPPGIGDTTPSHLKGA